MSTGTAAIPAKLTDNRIEYIIAVHGIGEQPKNETIFPVIKQFAARRHNDPKPFSSLDPSGLK